VLSLFAAVTVQKNVRDLGGVAFDDDTHSEPLPAQEPRPAADPLLHLCLRPVLRAQSPAEIARHVEEREQRGRLEHHRHASLPGRQPGDPAERGMVDGDVRAAPHGVPGSMRAAPRVGRTGRTFQSTRGSATRRAVDDAPPSWSRAVSVADSLARLRAAPATGDSTMWHVGTASR